MTRFRAARPFRLLAAAILAAGTSTMPGGPAVADAAQLTIAVARADGEATSASDKAFHGFERALAAELCRRMASDCAVLDADRTAILPDLLAGKTDAALAALPETAALKAIVGFSAAYAAPRHGFVIARAGSLAELPGTGETPSLAVTPSDAKLAIDALREALAGRRIGAQAGTADLEFLTAHFGEVASIDAYPTTDSALQAMLQGRLDAVMAPVTDFAASGQRPGFQELVRSGPEFGEDPLFGEGIAVALRQSDPDLRDRFSRAIDGMISDGSLRILSLRWFAMDVTPHRCACKPF